MTLQDISQPVRHHLEQFEKVFARSIRSNVGLVDVVTKYLIRQKGKKVRPLLVLLSAELCGGVNEKTYRGATLVEILHTATLIHDDVVDDADTRRGLASINAIWKNKIAVLMGDYLLSKGLLLSLQNDDFDFLKIISTAVRRMSEGEIYQIQKSRELDMDEQTYLQIIGDKTASLLATCTEIGATSSSADAEHRRLLREYGEHVGLAFQIRDDLLDYIGRKSITGKPTGLDLSEKKLTLPLIHAFTQASRKEGKEILSLIRNGAKKNAAKRVVEFVEHFGGITYASKRAREFAERAKQHLAPFPYSASKQALLNFADFVVERDK
ncbi:MAG TPA: polyprenyl synthetase family protein [Bacteroidota bacterium]|nr:polyprenyl synthetase family protein [Bacteroidota bacterium]